MKTENGIMWYIEGDTIMVATDSYGTSDGSQEYTWTSLTQEDMITMLNVLGATVTRKQETDEVYLDNNPARLDDGPMRFDKYDVATVVVKTLKEKGRTCCG